MPASPIRKLMPLAESARSRGIKVLHLNIGQPDIETPRPMVEAYHRFQAKVLAYGPSAGLMELRTAVARYYVRLGHAIQPTDVHVTVGGSEALLFAFAAVTDPGDSVIAFEPFYANYNAFAQLLGVHVRPVLTSFHDGFHLPPDDQIHAAIGERTRAIVIGSPGNPTGVVYNEAELSRVLRIAKERDLFVISDEVYREFVYAGRRTAPSALEFDESDGRVIVADSISKRFSACGARIGCTVSKSPDVNHALMRLCFARLCPATVDQYAAIAGYEMGPDYFGPVVNEYRQRRDTLVDGLSRISGVRTYVPEGAFYTMVELPIDDADTFCAWMLNDFADERETVMMAPGTGFYATPGAGKREVRIAYVLEQSLLVRAVEILKRALFVYPGRNTDPGA